MLFRFPPDARWNPDRAVVEVGIGVGEYGGHGAGFSPRISKSAPRGSNA
jgi:hypothetical protein